MAAEQSSGVKLSHGDTPITDCRVGKASTISRRVIVGASRPSDETSGCLTTAVAAALICGGGGGVTAGDGAFLALLAVVAVNGERLALPARLACHFFPMTGVYRLDG